MWDTGQYKQTHGEIKLKKIVKIITFYDDGTFTESTPYVGAPMPYPGTQPWDPSTPYGPIKQPLPEPYWNSKQCPKCGLKLEGAMGYVCPNNPCPCGMGGVYCTTGDCV